MHTRGRIHSIETLGTVDGPGIRTVIFFQGCPLRCRYCHNPDTWDLESGKDMTVEELMACIRRYTPYFAASNGGVTLSGGEPGLQPEFAAHLLEQLQGSGIHTALDTSGFLTSEAGIVLLAHTDLVILDIKHMNPSRFFDLTGQKLDRTLAFAQQVTKQNIPLWVRQVLVPGWTDDPAQLQSLALFCNELDTLERLELLPYHRLGVHKWEMLGLPYTLQDTCPPKSEDLHKAAEIIRESGPGLPLLI